MGLKTIDKETFQETIHHLLRSWHKLGPQITGAVVNLRCFRQFAAQHRSTVTQSSVIVQRWLESALTTLAQHNPEASNLLQKRFIQGTGARVLAQTLAISESQFYLLQNEALQALADVLLVQEKQAQFEHQLAIESRLEPLAHQRLFGVKDLMQQLQEVVTAPAEPWLISIEGLGGLGKTSLADRLVRELIADNRFLDIGWVSTHNETFHPAIGTRLPGTSGDYQTLTAEILTDRLLTQFGQLPALALSKNEKFSVLSRLLKQEPYLIVIDNLETRSDYQDLIPSLRRLSNPSKFILTSRMSLRAYADIWCLSLTELSQTDTLTFLSYEARSRRLTSLTQVSSEHLASIFEVVGGNPLALKLVLGQIHALPLEQVLNNLKQAQGRKITELYTHIYWQSWNALSDAGRQVLLSLPLASPRGSSSEHLLAVSGLDATDLGQALEELIAFSLIEAGGDLDTRRYSIHRLTETFLLTEVTQWH